MCNYTCIYIPLWYVNCGLSYIGIEVQTPGGEMIAGVMCPVDLPARAMVLHMKQWNGAYGCASCDDEGTCSDGDHLHHYWLQKDGSIARTHSSVLMHAETATNIAGTVMFTRSYPFSLILTSRVCSFCFVLDGGCSPYFYS